MGKEGALAMVKAAFTQGVSASACAAVMRGWMAWIAGREAAEEAAAPYRWETRVRSLLRWRRRMGLWRSEQECQAPLAASTRLAVDREVLYGPGGQVAVLAHGHNAHGRVVGVCIGDGGEAVE